MEAAQSVRSFIPNLLANPKCLRRTVSRVWTMRISSRLKEWKKFRWCLSLCWKAWDHLSSWDYFEQRWVLLDYGWSRSRTLRSKLGIYIMMTSHLLSLSGQESRDGMASLVLPSQWMYVSEQISSILDPEWWNDLQTSLKLRQQPKFVAEGRHCLQRVASILQIGC